MRYGAWVSEDPQGPPATAALPGGSAESPVSLRAIVVLPEPEEGAAMRN